MEDIDYRAARGLDEALLRSLAAESAWVERHENVFVCGTTGVGKSFLACALAQKACRDGYPAFYTRAAALFRDLALARADGSLRNMLLRLSKVDVLVVDDWAMTPLTKAEAREFREICEDRCQAGSMVLTLQMPVAKWHSQIGDSTVAEGILDRIVHRAHRFELKGDSMRKKSAEAAGAMKPLRVSTVLKGRASNAVSSPGRHAWLKEGRSRFTPTSLVGRGRTLIGIRGER